MSKLSMSMALLLSGCGTGWLDCIDGCSQVNRETIYVQGTPGQQGPTGPVGKDGIDGVQGEQGADGSPGQDGAAGASCTIEAVTEGAEVTCGGQTVLVRDGVKGADAVVPLHVAGYIDLCGNGEEVLLRMSDGNVMAHYSQGSKQYLKLLKPGSYVTTDGLACAFTLDAAGTVTDMEGTTWTSP
jgi:hypothetical protein